jgi:beta-lactamase class A
MTSRRWIMRTAAGLALLAAASVGASGAIKAPSPKPTRAAAKKLAAAAPAFIRDRITELGKAFDGRVGIAVKSIDQGWMAGWQANDRYPQQSVS